MRSPVPGPVQGATVLLFGSVSLHGFAQLTGRESLRDIETCLRALQPKLYHVGIRAHVSRTTLARANENRDWRIYAEFVHVLIRHARTLYARDAFGVQLDQTA